MKIAVFTSNQARHVALVEALAGAADEIWVTSECKTIAPGKTEDRLVKKSPVMERYFDAVVAAEREVFGEARFMPPSARVMPLKMGDLGHLEETALRPVLDADLFVVFGASYIKGPLIDLLIARRAINIHIGVSPYFRGSACNFWAMYDRRPDLVGATIHLLSKGLDSGPILLHALPHAEAVNPFVHGMRAVAVAHQALVAHITTGDLKDLAVVDQDKTQEIRYARHTDFTDEIAAEYLGRAPTPEALEAQLRDRDPHLFHNAFIA